VCVSVLASVGIRACVDRGIFQIYEENNMYSRAWYVYRYGACMGMDVDACMAMGDVTVISRLFTFFVIYFLYFVLWCVHGGGGAVCDKLWDCSYVVSWMV
jgi:hypothetical protein